MAMSAAVQEPRFTTDTFRVWSSELAPVLQLPPQRGFPTIQRRGEKVLLMDQEGRNVGHLVPATNRHSDSHLLSALQGETAVCVVTESHSANSATADVARRSFPSAGVESFMCAVTYTVEVGEQRISASVSGPRIVSLGDPYESEDGHRVVDLEILEMYLSGFDAHGSLITVRGGSRFGLPTIPGQVKSIAPGTDFPANLYFDLTLEITNWARHPAGSSR